MGFRSIGLMCVILLAGCAHKLPIDDATAFRTLATANRDSFQALAKSESEGVTTFVSRRLEEGVGQVSYVGCKLEPPKGEETQPCTVVWKPRTGNKIELRPTAVKTRALIGALAGYGDQMATLAEAKDLTEAQSSIDGVATSIKALGTAVGIGPVAGVIVDAAVWIGKRSMIEKRRSVLLKAAEKADPAVQLAARQMGEISSFLRQNLAFTASSRITDARLAIGAAKETLLSAPERATEDGATAIAAGPTPTATALSELVQGTQDLQAARDLSTDYSALGTAHTKLIAALRNRKGSTADALADMKTFLALLKAAETATKGE